MSWPSDKPPWKHVQWYRHDIPTKPEYQPNPHWSLLLPMPDLSGSLINLKHEIELLDSIGEWEFLKRSSNPYELVFSQSHDTRIPGSVCSLRPLSRSFFKMVELLTILQFYKRHGSTLRSAHVCEGPGGFIEALHHIATKKSVTISASYAMTLKPSMPNIPGWKRAFHFLRRAPTVHIDYGADDTGNIMVPANQSKFLEKARGKCSIFTADGGFDFSEHYSTQEDEVFPLLVSSSLLGLQTLTVGGDFILKVFDTELKSTKDLIILLSYCFDSWTLYKPSLSRPCNAEKYFLGRGCRMIPQWVLKTLYDIQHKHSTTQLCIRSIFTSVPIDIYERLEKIKGNLVSQQKMAVEYAILHKEEWNARPSEIWSTIQTNSIQWCQEFKMPTKVFHQPVASHTNLSNVAQP